jgi:hypothetical protein
MQHLNTILLVSGFLSLFACRKAPETVPLPTELCIVTSHHLNPVRGATVYIKFFSDTFPGYDKPPSFFDASFVTGGPKGGGCYASIPEGKHWMVAHGFDSIYHFEPHPLYGSLPFTIDLATQPKVDTVLYMSE